MSSTVAVENGGSPVLLLLAASGFTFLSYIYMSKSHFIQANTNLLFRLALELALLALVGFTAAVGVLSIYHSRVDHQGQQLSEHGALTGRRIASPLDFAFSGDC